VKSESVPSAGPRRGAASNPACRFDRILCDADPEVVQPDPDEPDSRPAVATRFYRDPARRALSFNQSPDIPFDASINPYRGCEHGCIYCYARPTHEYLGFSAGLDFETRILVKQDLPQLLRHELGTRSWKPQVVAIGSVTDAYQPIERRLRITRSCLEVLLDFRNPVAIVTKSALVTRDIDLFRELARFDAIRIYLSITTLDPALHRAMEPRAAAPSQRLAAIRELANAGIPVGVMVAPIIPGLTDHEVASIVEASAASGAKTARHMMLRLPHGLAPLFEEWLERHHPHRKSKVLQRIRDMRNGKLNDSRFHDRMHAKGFFADQTHALFDLACRRAGLVDAVPELSTESFRSPGGDQLALFA